MAFAAVGTFLTDGNKTAGASRTVASSTTIEVDNLAILAISCDNLTTTDGNSNDITSVTDVRGNTWSKALEYTNGNGAAGAGITVAFFYCVPTTQITAGDNITVNFAASLTAKALKGSEFTKGAGTIIAIDGTGQEAVDAGDPGSITLTGANSGEHLWIRAVGGATATTTLTASSGYLRVNATASSGGASDTNAMVGWEYKIATGTGSGASNPTCSTADWASVMVGLIETSATQNITGASFTNSQSFGTGTIASSYAISGAGFTNSQTFGTGTISASNAIAGTGFTNSESFGVGTIANASSTQVITGAGFTNANQFGAGSISNTSIISTDGWWKPKKGRALVEEASPRDVVKEALNKADDKLNPKPKKQPEAPTKQPEPQADPEAQRQIDQLLQAEKERRESIARERESRRLAKELKRLEAERIERERLEAIRREEEAEAARILAERIEFQRKEKIRARSEKELSEFADLLDFIEVASMMGDAE